MAGIEIKNPTGGSGSVGTLTITEIGSTILTTSAGAWVQRTLTAGPNKVVQVKVIRATGGTSIFAAGVRKVGSIQNLPDVHTRGTTIYDVTTDGNGNIEILGSVSNIIFIELNKKEIL